MCGTKDPLQKDPLFAGMFFCGIFLDRSGLKKKDNKTKTSVTGLRQREIDINVHWEPCPLGAVSIGEPCSSQKSETAQKRKFGRR